MAEPLQPEVEPVKGGEPNSRVEPDETPTETLTPITEPLPIVVVETPAPPRKRRRWIGWLIAAVVLVILLVVAFFVGDALARQYATGYVRERIIEVLKLDPATPVDVDLGPGSILLQAASGSINEVHVGVDDVAFGDLTGSAQIVATGVPIDGAKPVDTLGITVTVTEENVRKLAGFLSGIELNTIELGDGLITVGTDLQVLFFTLPVTVGLAPSASEGGISFEPETLTLDNQQISVDDLRNNPIVGGIAGQVLASQNFCVASYLPTALAITDVDVVDTDLVVQITGDGVALGGPELSTNGTCP